MPDDHPLIRQFLRREEEERIIQERRYPPNLRPLALRIFNEAFKDPSVRAKRPGASDPDMFFEIFEDATIMGSVQVGYESEEELIVHGLAFVQHEGLGGLRLVLQLTTEPPEPETVLKVQIREEDRESLPAVDDWLDELAQRNHPYSGQLLELTENRLAFLPRQGVSREAIVLPEDILDEMERNFGFLMGGTDRPEALRHRAVLLAGDPGVGKTLLCRWLAEQVTATVLWVTPGTVWRVGPARVFQLARMLKPALVVLEDLDVAARHREGGQPLGELLTQMDGFAPLADIGIVATTNHPDVLDHALDPRTRPGRFHRMIFIERPDAELQAELLRRLVIASAVLPDELITCIPRIVEAVPRATGARLATLVTELEHRWVWEQHQGRRPDPEVLVQTVIDRESTGRRSFGFTAGAA